MVNDIWYIIVYWQSELGIEIRYPTSDYFSAWWMWDANAGSYTSTCNIFKSFTEWENTASV